MRECLLLIACLSTIACATTEENEGPPGYYKPAGWLNLEDTLHKTDFTNYQTAVAQRVQRHRLIINTGKPAAEIALVSPAEFAPIGTDCVTDEPEGIVVLVHGLSDTAFAMRDLAAALARRCYQARTLLLPGHGTVPGDLLAVSHDDWLNTVRNAVEHAATENEKVVVIGFSLGAVLGLSLALEPASPIDALVSISPAFHLSSWRLARWAPWLHKLRPWIDRELPDDRFRYEAMPTRGVAETVRAIREMRQRLSSKATGIKTPWMLVQSMDDAVTEPISNLEFFLDHASQPDSRALVFRSAQNLPADSEEDARVIVMSGADDDTRVMGLTHVAVHVSPENPHYGLGGDYRNCGATGGRTESAVALCETANSGEFDYALWNVPDTTGRPQARSTFNPKFERTVNAIEAFIDDTNIARIFSKEKNH